MKLKDKKICFLGDSITKGVGTSCEEAQYCQVLAREAEVKEVRNYGVSASEIAGSRSADSFCQRFAQMEDGADVVVVFGGTNDYGHDVAPFGNPSDQTADSFCGALNVLMEGLIQKYPDACIVFLTPLHRENDMMPNQTNQLPLKAYVDAIKEAACRHSIPVLDLFATAGIQPDISAQKERYVPDGLHPNDAGNERIAERLKAFLESL